jgi:YHS domain-containing protein
MTKTWLKPALAGAFALGLATAAFAATGEFDDMCAMGLTSGKQVKTDCSISEQIGGKTYCFGNEAARTEFMKDPQGNVAKAGSAYQKEKTGG